MIIEAVAKHWYAARSAFLALPPGSDEVRAKLNDLAEAEDLLAKTAGGDLIDIHTFGGYCPVQAEGVVDGKEFYFRARYKHWTMGIGGDVVMAPEWSCRELYSEDEFAAGHMDHEEALVFIAKAVARYRAR